MRFAYCFVASAALLIAAPPAQAGEQGCDTDCGCQVRCPSCDHVCKFSVKTEKEAKNCYRVECKQICVPKVVFPWQKKGCDTGCANGRDCAGDGCGCCAKCKTPHCSCVNNGVRVRNVRVLKKFEYECEECKYKWEAVPICGNCNGGCTAGNCDAGHAPVPAPPAPAASAAANRGYRAYNATNGE